MKVNINNPLELFEDDVWQYIANYSDSNEYNALDLIFQFLSNEIERDDLPQDVLQMTTEELQAEYDERFPIMFGKALKEIGEELVSGGISMEMSFESAGEDDMANCIGN